MKSLVAFLALVILTIAPLTAHADPLISLSTNGVADLLVKAPVANGEQYVYTNLYTDVFNTTLQTFTATYTDILGVSLLNVTDVCAQVNIVIAAKPCSALAFSYTDLSLGDAVQLATLGTVGLHLTGDAVGINFGASIGGGSAEIGFGNPPTNSPVPEPGTISLLATGLVGAAGMVRRRFAASA